MNRLSPQDVTFYIPVRDDARTLTAAIESVRAQTRRPAELILVVDERSTDDSPRMARESGARVITQKDGRLGAARNLAIAACRTSWLASCDADVALAPEWLERLLASVTPDCGAIGGATHELLVTNADRWRAVNLPHNWGDAPLENPYMLVSEMLASVSALRAVGGYRPDLQSWEDSDLCQRLRQAGYTLRYQPLATAQHDRRDSVESVLNLRWFYSLHRQRERLTSLSGLAEKLPINRTYCLQSLSQTIHSPHADVCAISILLWIHHALRDLRAALENWPLLSTSDRVRCTSACLNAMRSALVDAWFPLQAAIDRLLPTTASANTCEIAPNLPPPSAAPLPPTCEANAVCGFADTPGFALHTATLASATAALLAEIPTPLAEFLCASAARLADETRPVPERPPLTPRESDGRRLAERPLHRAWIWGQLANRLSELTPGWCETSNVCEWGWALEDERPPDLEDRLVRAKQLVLLPHLEASPDPYATLREALAAADIAAIAYQPPDAFIAAIPTLMPRDIASVCAAAGFAVREFLTEPRATRLIVERVHRARHEATPRATAAALETIGG
ncbi:MAG: glycosyltransferase family A protein [Phycisphaerae bacterium]